VPRRGAARFAGFLALLGIGGACAYWLATTTWPTSPPLPPRVEYARCAAVLVPAEDAAAAVKAVLPVCVLRPQRELHLWVAALPGTVELEVDGRTLAAVAAPVGGGQRFALILPPGVRQLAVHVEDRAPWRLSVADGPGDRPAARVRDLLAEAKAKGRGMNDAIRDRDLAAVRATLAGLRLSLEAPAESHYLASYYRALLAEREGDYRSGLNAAREAVEIAGRTAQDRYQLLAQELMAILLRGVGRSAESARLFAELRRQPQARRASACEQGQLLNNQAWSELLAREGGERMADPTPLLEEALASYERCELAKPERQVNTLVNLALAHLQEERLGEAKRLLARASEVEPHPPVPQVLWELDLEARIALRERRFAEALHGFVALERLAVQTGSLDGRLRALVGRARSQQALGERATALATLAAAESVLDEQSLQVPMQEGRETFVTARESIVGLHLELLLAEGRLAEAFQTARRARSRVLRQLAQVDRLASLRPEQRDRRARLLDDYRQRRAALEAEAREDWRLPIDEREREQAARTAAAIATERLLDEAFLVLGGTAVGEDEPSAPPRPGELVLAYHPIGGGWVGFAADATGVAARRFELPSAVLASPVQAAARLLQPFAARITRAQRLRILTSGRLESVDFHALPFGGAPLLAGRPVTYGLDLPRTAPAPGPHGRRALLVTDPRGDLPGAVGEARTVRRLLESASPPWIAEELRAAAASAPEVDRRLAAADLLHYAGHGSYSGLGGWDSSLLLADKTQLTLGDLLALDAVPEWVVLSGCDTGRSAAETPVAGLGLAHAFLLAGSRLVVASTRPTEDRTVPAFLAQLYEQWDRHPDLAVALQQAQLAWRNEAPQADWASFRLFEP
jgi:cellulose synthase operon protein C